MKRHAARDGVEAIAERLAAAIAAHEFPQGSLLPGERPLCLRLGVSRPALREAIRLLAARGLVESRHGQGTRVISDHGRPMRGAFAGVLAAGSDAGRAEHLLELRLAIETAMAAAAARRRSAEDIAELEAILVRFALEEDLERSAALDLAFHARLAEAARNPLFSLVLKPLSGLLDQDRPAGLAGITRAAALTDHRAIVAALRKRRPAAAAAAMRRHLERVSRATTPA